MEVPKPESFYQLVDKLCPDITKLEMFARESRDGWDCWGDQADLFDQLGAEINTDTSLSA
ncbi:MT-A70 family methyltransferase [Nostoc sp. 'Peltigera membranacea cyanobiont' 213]|uniref:MT-A70 family methyltransferase n=1 Tax=Nostoc sp. 'Peltigera membranacea cyanobiont' 213 TaxID=2014530 RepID=UPI001CB94264|nr:MT-A70 family methyltransferase [Nostoc sp. 'Peltigera membranacea cyanobiont' 213]